MWQSLGNSILFFSCESRLEMRYGLSGFVAVVLQPSCMVLLPHYHCADDKATEN